MSFDELSDNVIDWAYEKGILERENAPKQMLKVLEEVGETAGALLKDNEEGIKDGIGDSFVTLIILSRQLGLTPEEWFCWHAIGLATGERLTKSQSEGMLLGSIFEKNRSVPIAGWSDKSKAMTLSVVGLNETVGAGARPCVRIA